ncbi:hypothetical protein [Henriciella sp.]|uniref:hypothetical protein n=1 Tax=Henriciella sp. TaxID=1968823 RepID=UPI00260E5A22|nr:hypothetical protein [Henriciella sp.]
MGKRSDFARLKGDFYRTPKAAVIPLVPHLPERFLYSEPCAGDGCLIEHLRALHQQGWCVQSDDIDPKHDRVNERDALSPDWSLSPEADLIITNPPWTREILHPMIERFSALRPTWLLFDADWMHTHQARPYLAFCRKIVSVGRVKWIADSPHTGKDNAAWYLFDQSSEGAAEFIGRAA